MVGEIDLKRRVEHVGAETRRHFDVTSENIDRRIQFVAEAVAQLDVKVTREVGGGREDMSRGFAETQAMIKFS